MQESTKGEAHNVIGGTRIESVNCYDALTLSLSERNEPVESLVSCSSPTSIASTPPPTSAKQDPVEVFFLRPLMDKDQSVYTDSSSSLTDSTHLAVPPNSKTTLSDEDESMPSLVPSVPFKANKSMSPPRMSRANGVSISESEDDMDIPYSAPTSGNISYHGPARADGRTEISFTGLTRAEAEEYLNSESAKYNDYHSVYIPNVVQAIESFCFCQDEIIANDWSHHMFQDGSYSGHPTISGGAKLPTGGPRSGRTWHERVRELRDHRAHSRHLINVIETVLSTRMLAEASRHAHTIKCDHFLHIQGGISPSTYLGRYEDANPFFSESECKRLNSYAAIAENHGEPIFGSKILDALLMPFPDEDTIRALTESRLLDVGTIKDILRLALDRDLVLGIARTGLTTIATSPFRSEMFEDPFYSKEWFVLSDIAEEPEEEPKSKAKKFFL